MKPEHLKKNSRGTVWMPEAERDALREYAERHDLSESQVMRRALRLLLSEEKQQPRD